MQSRCGATSVVQNGLFPVDSSVSMSSLAVSADWILIAYAQGWGLGGTCTTGGAGCPRELGAMPVLFPSQIVRYSQHAREHVLACELRFLYRSFL